MPSPATQPENPRKEPKRGSDEEIHPSLPGRPKPTSEVEDILNERKVTAQETRELLQTKLKTASSLGHFLDAMDAALQGSKEAKNLATSTLAAMKGEASEQKLAIVSKAVDFFLDAVASEVKQKEGPVVAIEQITEKVENQVASLRENPETGSLKSSAPQQASQPALRERPQPQQTDKTEIAKLNPSTKVDFHNCKADGSLATLSRELRLGSDGSVLEGNSANASSQFAAVYLDKGKAYLADGRQISNFCWGQSSLSANRVQSYLNSVSEGKLSGVKDGYLKDLRVLGKQAVFTKGLPPSLQKNTTQEKVAATSPVPRPATEQAKTPKTEKSEPNISQKERPNPELRLPPASLNKQSMQQNPAKQVRFQTDTGGQTLSSIANLRIGTDGSLQMQFGRAGSTSWLDPSNAPGRECVCLYHQNGKLLDASGKEVKSLQWGRFTTNTASLLRYVEPLRQGEISSVHAGYLNEVRLSGKRVVFTEGPPPSAAKAAPAQSPSQAPRQNKRVYSQQISKIDISAKQASGSYHGSSLQFCRGTNGELLARATSVEPFRDTASSSLKVGGAAVNFELLYRHQGKVFDGTGKEVTSLNYASNEIAAADFDTRVFRYTATRNDGGVYGMHSGYLADIRHGNKHVVFVNEAPPASKK